MKHDGKNKNTMNAIIRCANNTYIILEFTYLVTSTICIDVTLYCSVVIVVMVVFVFVSICIVFVLYLHYICVVLQW